MALCSRPPAARLLFAEGAPLAAASMHALHCGAPACVAAPQPACHVPQPCCWALRLQYGTMLVLGVGLRPLLDRQWSAVAICLLEGALLAALTVAARSDGAAYLRHRSLLLTLLSLEHFAVSSPAVRPLLPALPLPMARPGLVTTRMAARPPGACLGLQLPHACCCPCARAHMQLSRLISPTVVSPGCPHPLLSLLREINLSQVLYTCIRGWVQTTCHVPPLSRHTQQGATSPQLQEPPHPPPPPAAAVQLPWSALISLSLPIPVRHAAVAQTLLVGLSIAWLPSLRAKSFSLCAASEGHYRSAANVLATAAACVLPPPLGAVVLAQAQRLESAAFYAVHVMAQVAVNCGLVLSVLFSWELRQRRTFARQRRLAADAAALVRLQRNSTLSLPLLVLAGAVLWAAVTALLAGRPSLV